MIKDVYHIYNRSNDRTPVFHDDENYQFFLKKLVRQMKGVAEIIAYCLKPNHYHLLVMPLDTIVSEITTKNNGELSVFPTPKLGEAVRRLQMGYSKSYNLHFGRTGSRWCQHASVKNHGTSVNSSMKYLHFNPVEAGLVNDPSEWGFSSFNEYSGILHPSECIANIQLGRAILSPQS